jgi:hypothetical protein
MAFFGRGRNKIQDSYVLKDMYADYINDKEENSPYNISYTEYVNIIRDHTKMVMDNILDKAQSFKMPYRLGTIRIVKLDSSLSRKRRYSLDFSLTQKYGKPIYHLNEHSGGYKYMFKWDKADAYVKHKSFYRFIPTRTNKRKLAYNIKNFITDYFEI